MAGYLKTSSGKQTVRNAMPAAAGTNGALCAGPNGIFATRIANAAPAPISQIGAVAGRSIAIAKPVNTACISDRQFSFLFIISSATASTATALMIPVSIALNASAP